MDKIKKLLEFKIIMGLLGIMLLFFAFYYTSGYFVVYITINFFTFALRKLLYIIASLYLLIILLYNTNKKIVILLYWFLTILCLAILYISFIQAFLVIENVTDYLIKYKNFNIKIEYTLLYKQYFLEEYLNATYDKIISQYTTIRHFTVFSKESFKEMLQYLDFSTLVEKEDISSLKNKAEAFIHKFIEYKLEQAAFIVGMEKIYCWRESFVYNFGLFIRNSAIILIPIMALPYIIQALPFIIINRILPDFILRKAINIIEYHFNNYPGVHLVFEGTLLEQQDFFLIGAYYLIKTYGARWVYDQPWY